MNAISTDEAIEMGLFENHEKFGFTKTKEVKIWVVLKSGVVFHFYTEKQPISFDEFGWFVGSGHVKMPGEKSFSNLVENFTFHSNELSCSWVD